ncbi:hypothetical protein LK994_04090 [Ferruginibacter lapsinanis]|uniref:hypothetical protein n=1 Tax=Ferruginibacter lapsinanis TaxID=563172 RepID=UPI001E565CA0|nr:hypothetical protein [Ferruginibacter lapsinanis]UEG50651.1 hypothetical protein LK994_04090 [Ferruginibacter lapsinanis]
MVFVASGSFAQNMTWDSAGVAEKKYLQTPTATGVSHFSLQKNNTLSVPVLAGNFYANQLGFFCKQEIKLEKITKIPFKFRLGSVESCDRLEGKFKYH